MARLSGYTGKISLNGTAAVVTVSNWTINPTANNPTGVASNSAGMEFDVEGPSDFTGTFDWYNTSPLGFIVPGTAYVFYGQNSAYEVMGGIICTSVTINCDIKTGAMLSGSAAFASIGSSTAVHTANNTALTYQAVTSVTNTAVPTIFPGAVCKAAWTPILAGVAGSNADLIDVTGWSLTLACDAPATVTSNTGGVTKRIRGPFRGCSATINHEHSSFDFFSASATRLIPGTVGIVRLYATASAYFALSYMRVNGLNLAVPIESGEYVGGDIALGYTGYTNVAGVITQGSIVDPNAVTMWP